MTLDFRKAEFELSCVSPEAFSDKPQVCFAGRSNAGKSSVINCLCGRKSLAYVGKTPGKTAHVNYFIIDGKLRLCDLPGYGYAKVSKEERLRWGRLMEQYFAQVSLSMGVIIVDARHKPTEDDISMARYFQERCIPFTVLANKSDKLKNSEYPECAEIIMKTLVLDKAPLKFSAKTGEGKNELIGLISAAT